MSLDKRTPLVIAGQSVDAVPTPPPAGYAAPEERGETRAETSTPAPVPAAPVPAPSANTEASETMVQATKLALRAFARHRDALPAKADRAAQALEDLRDAGGSEDQVTSVLSDARVKLAELDASRATWRPRR